MTEARGDPIPNSKYVRDYCATCGDPIRVSDVRAPNKCDECSGVAHPSVWIASDRRVRKNARQWRDDQLKEKP